jgi:hypothetical protein
VRRLLSTSAFVGILKCVRPSGTSITLDHLHTCTPEIPPGGMLVGHVGKPRPTSMMPTQMRVDLRGPAVALRTSAPISATCLFSLFHPPQSPFRSKISVTDRGTAPRHTPHGPWSGAPWLPAGMARQPRTPARAVHAWMGARGTWLTAGGHYWIRRAPPRWGSAGSDQAGRHRHETCVIRL